MGRQRTDALERIIWCKKKETRLNSLRLTKELISMSIMSLLK